MMIPRQRLQTHLIGLTSIGLLALLTTACGDIGQEVDPSSDYRTSAQALNAVCEVPVRGFGTIDMVDYVANVIACEAAPNSSPETLKAQAIAARTFAVFKLDVENRSQLVNSQGNQVYDCPYATAEAKHYAAARATAGQIITTNGLVSAGFYVAGVKTTSPTCIPTAREAQTGDPSETVTQNYVTYNQGRVSTGNLRRAGAPMGNPHNPHNIGVMSQNGAKCLGDLGKSSSAILRFFYGDDMRVSTMPGACGGNPDDPGAVDPGTPEEQPDGQCQSAAQAPAIIPRAQWGARPARRNRPGHTPVKMTLHHTYQPGQNGATAARNAQDTHMIERGWSDLGYHYLVDRDGKIYAGSPENRIGAHVLNQNTGNLGISMIGAFNIEQVSQAQKQAVASLMRHLGQKYNIEINRTNIRGHGERMATECPGGNTDIDEIVAMAQADTICEPTQPQDDNITPDFEYETPDIELTPTAQLGYKFLRITHTSGEPYIVDAIYHQTSGGEKIYTNRATGSGQNLSAAYGEPDVTTCAEITSNAALIPPGGQVTFEFPESLNVNSSFYIRGQGVGSLPDRPCSPGYTGRATIEASLDGMEWDLVKEDSKTNTQARIQITDLKIVDPEGNTANREATFGVEARKDVVRVDYYAERYPLGSSDAREDNFSITYKFQQTGKRLISAWGYTESGEAIAMDERYITITEGVDFIAPTDGETYLPNMVLSVATNDDVVSVVYEVNGQRVGQSDDKDSNFSLEHFFEQYGLTDLVAIGLDADGKEIARTTSQITIDENGNNFRFSTPQGGGVYPAMVRFSMEVTDPNIARVQYKADGQYDFGTSSSGQDNYSITYEFNKFGKRKIEALGFTEEGERIATATLYLTITDENGTVPSESEDYDPSQDPNSPESDGIAHNTTLAQRLAAEAFERDHPSEGSNKGGRSKGLCWAYVKAAMERAGLTRPPGYNGGAYNLLDTGRCGALYMSAYAFGSCGVANPAGMLAGFQLQRVDIDPVNALEGDVITWKRGCVGYNARHGHIEVAQGDGTACSDYCGAIRSGGKSCSDVFRPVENASGGNQPPLSNGTRPGQACTLNGQDGFCLNNGSTCGGQEGQGSCSGGQKCCVKGCSVGNRAGECLNTSSCGGTTTSNLCPGPYNVRCCTP